MGNQVLSVCAPLELDATASTGNGGRSFTSISWQLVAGESAQWWDGEVLSSVVNSFSSSLRQRIARNENQTDETWGFFFPPGQYTVRLTLENWAAGVSSTDFTFTRMNVSSPSVDIKVQTEVITTVDEVMVEGFATPGQVCNFSKSAQSNEASWNLRYQWNIESAAGIPIDVLRAGLSTRTNILTIPADTLSPGLSYRVSLTVTRGPCRRSHVRS